MYFEVSISDVRVLGIVNQCFLYFILVMSLMYTLHIPLMNSSGRTE